MLDDLIKEFEEDKNSKCSICGKEAAYNCKEFIGALSCDTALCNSSVCSYVHNLVKHFNNEALLTKYESKIPYDVRLNALNRELEKLNDMLKEYKYNLEKYSAIESVYNMFNDLIMGKEQEIERVTYKIKQIAKEYKITKYL